MTTVDHVKAAFGDLLDALDTLDAESDVSRDLSDRLARITNAVSQAQSDFDDLTADPTERDEALAGDDADRRRDERDGF